MCTCAERLAAELLKRGIPGPVLKSPIPSGSGDVELLGADAGLELVGFSFTETAGAAARLRLLEGKGSANDVEIADVQLSANESAREWWGDDGLPIPLGLFIDRTAGSTKGTIFWRRRVPVT